MVGVAFGADAILLAIAALTILRRVILGASEVDFRTILGAISVFTLLGLLFAFLFVAFANASHTDFFTGVADPRSSDYLFFSYTTLTTTGYGNLVPAGTVGQSFAVFEMLLGQFFLVTLVAGLVSLWRPGARKGASRRRSLRPSGLVIAGEGRPRFAHVRLASLQAPRGRRRLGRRGFDRERAIRSLTFWLRPAFLLRVVHRFQRIAGFDRALALASIALTALIPLVIISGAVLTEIGAEDTAAGSSTAMSSPGEGPRRSSSSSHLPATRP